MEKHLDALNFSAGQNARGMQLATSFMCNSHK
jgi:hypothetical protein